MIKRFSCIIMIVLLLVPLGGCWNYRGLDEMAIVTGVAIDKNPKSDYYRLTFEFVDMSQPVKEQGLHTKLIDCEGKTLFDAARNAKKRIVNKLYFGHMEVIILSEEIARSEDIGDLIDWFLRDGECRETMCVAISQEESAHVLLDSGDMDQAIVAFEMADIIKTDNKVTSSTICVPLYKVFNILHSEGMSLTLPAFHLSNNDGNPTNEANGIAVFKGGRLIGYLTAEESKYYLFALGEVNGGILTISSGGDGFDDTSLEISKNETKMSFELEDGKTKIFIKTDTDVFLNEIGQPIDALEKQKIKELQEAAQLKLEASIGRVVQKVQHQFDSDIFGFGSLIYKKDPKRWEQMSKSWEEQFKTLPVVIRSTVHIINSASIKNSESE